MLLNFSELSPNQIYHTMIQTVIPRPIAWVLSENEQGSFNVAPFSYFTAVSSSPPLMMFSVGKKSANEPKDTLKNISVKKEFIIHIAHAELVNELNESAATLDYGTSELDQIGLKTTPIENFTLPRIEQTKIAFACSLYEIKEIGNAPMALVFGEIQSVYICDNIVDTDKESGRNTINAEKLNPLARLGGNDYSTIAKPFTIARPK
jgi:flavin reductase (DIM6/NTAB) family NADH-FMN oxidoreductase RutF